MSWGEGVVRGWLTTPPGCLPSLRRAFTEKARVDYERFCVQRTADFRSLLVNYVQLQMHVHRKVGVALGWHRGVWFHDSVRRGWRWFGVTCLCRPHYKTLHTQNFLEGQHFSRVII